MMITPADIRAQCQKPHEQEETYAWYVTRRISPYATWFFIQLGVKPNLVTVFTLLFGIGSGILLAAGSRGFSLLGVIALQIMYILDCSDGELARVTRRFSVEGEYLDKISHYLIDITVITGFTLGVYSYWDYRIFLYIAVWSAACVVGNRLLLDAAYKLLFLRHAEKGIPPQQAWSAEAGNYTVGNRLTIPISRLTVSSRNKLYRILHGWFRFFPMPGYIYDTPALMNVITLAVIIDMLLPRSWLMKDIDFRLLVAVFYALSFSALFGVRLYSIFQRRVVTSWLSMTGADGSETRTGTKTHE